MTEYLSTTQRNQPRTGRPTDNFSDWVYSLRSKVNDGFVSFDIDSVLWNYKTKTFCFIEVKTKNAPLSYCQKQQYPILQRMLQVGATAQGFTFKGFLVLTFSNTCFSNGTATIQTIGSDVVSPITEDRLIALFKAYI